MKEREDCCAKAFERVLDEVGHFGYFQKRLFLMTTWLQVLVTPVILYFGLLTELPIHTLHKCRVDNSSVVIINSDTCPNSSSYLGPVDDLPKVRCCSFKY